MEVTAKQLRAIVGDNIRVRRQELGLTQVALGEACGCSHVHVSMMERGKTEPSLTLLAALAEALSTNPQALLSPEIFSPAA
ncbi:MAG: helix-turn-helix domain-containing protein [Planctomyces sp.]|nr:helix-turn-helix domain-containing protein [Planctomyces sp.]